MIKIFRGPGASGGDRYLGIPDDASYLRKRLDAPTNQAAVQLLPGIWTNHPRTWELLAALADELTRQFPVGEIINGEVVGGLPTTFMGLRTPNGISGVPFGVQPYSNVPYLVQALKAGTPEQAEFASNLTIRPNEQETIDIVLGLVVGYATIPGVAIDSEAMHGGFIKEKSWESHLLDLRPFIDQPAEYVKSLVEGDMRSLCNMRVPFFMTTGYRRQIDSPSMYHGDKKLTVPEINALREQALREAKTLSQVAAAEGVYLKPKKRVVMSMDDHGVQVPTEVDVSLPDVAPKFGKHPGMFGSRARTFSAGSPGMFPLRFVAHAWEEHMFQRFASTFHMTDDEALAERVSAMVRDIRNRFGSAQVRAVDVEKHDTTIHPLVLNAVEQHVGDVFGHATRCALHNSLHCPMLIKSDRPDAVEFAAWLGGVPDDMASFTVEPGNPSGQPATSAVCKAITAVYVGLTHDLWAANQGVRYVDKRRLMANLFEGKIGTNDDVPLFWVLIVGDNVLFIASDQFFEWMDKTGGSRIMRYDASETFAGRRVVYTPSGIKFTANAVSIAIKFMAHDRSIGSRFRRYWAKSWLERASFYSSCSEAHAIIAVMNSVVKRLRGKSIDDMARAHFVAPPPAPKLADNLRMLEEKPEAFYYLLTSRQKTPDVLPPGFLYFTGRRVARLADRMGWPNDMLDMAFNPIGANVI